MNEQAVNETEKAVQSESGLTKGDGYVYDTKTNWFDNFCNGLSKLFD